jgi:nucleoside-diphosphate-sugar epimerase
MITSTLPIDKTRKLVVTGSNGFIGSKVVEALLAAGYQNLRCFVRPTSRMNRLQEVIRAADAGREVEVMTGDLVSRDSCRKAAEGASIIYHLAAGMDKAFAGAFANSALATRNLVEAFLDQPTSQRFVNVSSFAVYSNVHLPRGALLDESCPLEDRSQERYDAYGFGKLQQELVVRAYGRSHGLRYVIVRPGAVFGPGKRSLSGRIGIDTFGFFIHLGGGNQLPLTYVDNCAEAIILAGLVPGIEGEALNIVDDDLPTSRQFMRAYKSRIGRFFSLSLPYFAAYGLSAVWEDYSVRSGGQLPPVFNRRRCAAEWKGNRFSNARARERLGWRPRVSMKDAMAHFLEQFPQRTA